MKASTKINILGWCLVGWSIIGILRGYVAVILILAGIGILLKKNIARLVMMYFSFFAVCMSILGIIGLPLAIIIPRLLSKDSVNQPENPNAILLGIGMGLMCAVLGSVFFYIYKLLKKEEIVAEFIKTKR
jgi:drug/metabolite transporter (DMT)-like permease